MIGFCRRINLRFSKHRKAASPITKNDPHPHILLAESESNNYLVDLNKFQDQCSDDNKNSYRKDRKNDHNDFGLVDDEDENFFSIHSLDKRNDDPTVSEDVICPYKDLGCTTVLKKDENISSHLRAEIYQHSVLLIEWIRNIEDTMLIMSEARKQVPSQPSLERIQKGIDSMIINPSQSNDKDIEDYQIVCQQLRNELSNVTVKFCGFAKLIRDLKAINDQQIKQLNDSADRHDKEISKLKQEYQRHTDNIQQELAIALENARQSDEEIRKLKKIIEKLHSKTKPSKSVSTSRTVRLKKISTSSTMTSTMKDDGKPKDTNSSLEWDINELSQKIENHYEVWSKYFPSPNRRFTMRLWVHLNDVMSYGQVGVELLIWNHVDHSNVRFGFTGLVTISIQNQRTPSWAQTISKHCIIENPNYSELFIFDYFDLQKAGVLDDNAITVLCVVVHD